MTGFNGCHRSFQSICLQSFNGAITGAARTQDVDDSADDDILILSAAQADRVLGIGVTDQGSSVVAMINRRWAHCARM